MILKQASLFPSDADLAHDLNKKFPGVSRLKINQALKTTRKILDSKTDTDGGYPNSQLKHWTEIVLRDSEHSAGRGKKRKKITGLSQNYSRKIILKVPDGKSAGANDDTYKD